MKNDKAKVVYQQVAADHFFLFLTPSPSLLFQFRFSLFLPFFVSQFGLSRAPPFLAQIHCATHTKRIQILA